MERRKINVFYSWQSDSPKKTNLNAIRTALKDVAKRIEARKLAYTVVPDEATRNVPGSPNIAAKITEKIEHADIFIADVTTITPSGSTRPCPNPNVTHELGFAVAHMGWDRVILLFNSAHGLFPADLPFDFAQHRAHDYQFNESGGAKERRELADFLAKAVEQIIESDPPRPAQLRSMSREQIEHNHDLRNIEWLMSTIHLPTMDDHINQLPHMMTSKAVWYSDHLAGVAENSLFHVYDSVIRRAVDQLHSAWRRAMSHDNCYHDIPSGHAYVFSNPMDAPLSKEQQKDWDDIEQARRDMRIALDTLLSRIRSNFVEIYLSITNKKAFDDYIEFKKEFDEEDNIQKYIEIKSNRTRS